MCIRDRLCSYHPRFVSFALSPSSRELCELVSMCVVTKVGCSEHFADYYQANILVYRIDDSAYRQFGSETELCFSDSGMAVGA